MGLVGEFDMDDCQLTNNASAADGVLFGSSCACGVVSNGLFFDGAVTSATFDQEIKEVFTADWSMTFYTRIENTGDETVDIFFLGENCGRDSVFTVRYFAASQRFRVRLSDSPNNEVQLDGQSNDNTCWQYLAITKEGSIMRFYINGVLQQEASSVSALSLDVNGNLRIAGSPCLVVPVNADRRVRGRIDELRFFNRVLDEREIRASDLQPDQIRTRDTTIFVGETIQLQTGGSCTMNFTWSPTSFMDDPNSLNPRVSPIETTTYTLTINDGTCAAVDQVRVNVVSREELTCEGLLLPNAFTPNGDNINDNLGISNKFLIEEMESFEIFNRWGGRVFFTNDIDGTWDGRYKNEIVQASSFVYVVNYTCEGASYSKSGTVHVMR